MFCTWPHFKSEGFWNSEVAYSASTKTRIHATNLQQHQSWLRHTIDQSAIRPTFRDANSRFPAKRRLRNERRNSILGWGRSYIRRHFAGKPVVVSRNADCFLRLQSSASRCFRRLLQGVILLLYFTKIHFHGQEGWKRWIDLACVAGAWKWWAQEKTGAREGDTPRVSPSRASVLSFAHYFQAPATQAMIDPDNQVIILKSSLLHIQHQVALQVRRGSHQLKSLSKL